jgi:hypothetical protein
MVAQQDVEEELVVNIHSKRMMDVVTAKASVLLVPEELTIRV